MHAPQSPKCRPMPRPRKSTYNAWLDVFSGWTPEDRAGAIKALEMIDRALTQAGKLKKPEQQPEAK